MRASQFVNTYKGKLSQRDYSLLVRAVNVLESNRLKEYVSVFSNREFITPDKNVFKGVWNWDSAFHGMAVSRYDKQLAFDQIEGFLSYIKDDGMLPDNLLYNGDMGFHSSKPPVFAWAALETAKRTNDNSILKRVYEKLVLNEKFWRTQRFHNGLFHYGTYMHGTDEENLKWAGWETGWDNSVRWDNGIFNLYPVDLNCYMLLFYKSMVEIAEILGFDTAEWMLKAKDLERLIESRFWNEEISAYTDRYFSGEFSFCLTPASFMPLFVETASDERAEKMAKIAEDENKFNSTMPTVSFDNPEYSTKYWRGPLWLNTAYFAAKGLKNYNFPIADIIKENILSLVDLDKEHIYENYDAKNNVGLCAKNFSWSACFIIEFILNW